MSFNNQQSYAAILEAEREQREREREEAYDQMMEAAYQAREQRMYDEIGMTEEDRVMSALENGYGELYGY